mgnify:CR=1 FL=1
MVSGEVRVATVTVTFPGRVTNANESGVTDGNSVTWTELKDSTRIEATGKDSPGSPWPWIIAGVAAVVVVVAVAMLVVGYGILDWGFAPSFIIFFLIWGIGMAMLIQCERIKKRYDLVTYREILAFSKGETVDRDNPKSRRAREHRTVKAVAIMLVAAAIGAVIGWFTAPYIL